MKKILSNKMIKLINNSLINLPTPINISYLWNFGSLLGLCLMIQIISGLMISIHYCPNVNLAFNSLIIMIQSIKYGWLIHNIHLNGATMFFICIYIHIARGIFFNSFKFFNTWMIGTIILLLLMMTAFMGYVLPWGQMSFWGATVITNLLSTIPYIGNSIVQWLWGGFSINNSTLNRFYSFHFILPFILVMMMMIHLIYLHETGSSNPMGINSNNYKIPFNPLFSLKDLFGFMILLFLLISISLVNPYIISDPENFMPANPMITPIHIQPEWYFLFAYAILRSIPNKLGGTIALLMSIMILMYLPMNSNLIKMNSSSFYPLNQILFWMLINSFFILTVMGAKPIEYPYMIITQLTSIIYFSLFIIYPFSTKFWFKQMKK